MYERFRGTAVATLVAITVCSSGPDPNPEPLFCATTGTNFQGPDTVFGLLTAAGRADPRLSLTDTAITRLSSASSKRARLGSAPRFDEMICAVRR